MPQFPDPPIVAVVGATAAGKTGLSLDLAERLEGEIVNTDAMQVYRGMDVGTAKVPETGRRGIPHHLLDLLDVTEPLTVAEFQTRARAAVAEIRSRGRTPVLVGGSALYTRAVLDRFEFPGTDPEVRRGLEAELAEHGAPALHRRLTEVDAAAAQQILPDNGRRIVRALEVIELTGAPFTAALPSPTPYYRSVQIGVDRDTEALDRRIADRVELMWAAGLLDEVRGLAGLREGRTASRALGYQQALAQLDGELTREQAVEETVRATRRFVRRQRSWFRRDRRIVWLEPGPDLLDRALRTLSS